jgi:hypothetical protein
VTKPAGWYPDPDGSGGQRYFDGQSWTDHRSPAAPVAVEAPALESVGAEPKSSGPSGKVVAGIIAAVAVVLIIGAAAVYMTLRSDVGDATVTRTPADAAAQTSDGVSTPTEVEAGQEGPTLENQAGSVGQPARDGNFEFVVTGVERVPVIADPEYPELQKTPAGEYLLVRMKVTNVGAEPQTFFASFNTLSDGTTEFTADDEAWVYLGNTVTDLNPGDSIDTAVVFDVPVGTEPESVELHDGPFSDGVVVGL